MQHILNLNFSISLLNCKKFSLVSNRNFSKVVKYNQDLIFDTEISVIKPQIIIHTKDNYQFYYLENNKHHYFAFPINMDQEITPKFLD